MNSGLRHFLIHLLALLHSPKWAPSTIIISLFPTRISTGTNIRATCCTTRLSPIKRNWMPADILGTDGCKNLPFAMIKALIKLMVNRELHFLVELSRKRIWNDSKCANTIDTAGFHSYDCDGLLLSIHFCRSQNLKILTDPECKAGDLDHVSDADGNNDDNDLGMVQAHAWRDENNSADLWNSTIWVKRKRQQIESPWNVKKMALGACSVQI